MQSIPMVCKFLGNTILEIFLQYSNALESIDVTLSGIETCFKFVRPLNAPCAIVVTGIPFIFSGIAIAVE